MVKAISDLKVDTQVRGSPRVPDIPRIFAKTRKVYTINQTLSSGVISVGSTSPSSGAVYFTLSNVPLNSAFQALFDSYKVQQMTVRFVPLGSVPAGGGYNPLVSVIDYDDANALTSIQSAQAYDNAQETPLGQYCERTLVPRVALAAYSGAFTSYATMRSWIDVASNAVQHYGVKYYIVAATTAIAAPIYAIEIDVVISFLSVR